MISHMSLVTFHVAMTTKTKMIKLSLLLPPFRLFHILSTFFHVRNLIQKLVLAEHIWELLGSYCKQMSIFTCPAYRLSGQSQES